MKKTRLFARTYWIGWAVLCIAFLVPELGAETCPVPSSVKRAQVETYVIARYELSMPEVVLLESKAANEACFWLFRYQVSGPKKQEISVYLSPDGNYLLPALYDLNVDPQAERVALRQSNQKALLDGISPEIGPENAPVTIVEFGDFECPFCKRMADTLRKDLPSEGNRVRFVFRNYPLPMHPWAMAAAEMAECVTLQKPSEFWKVHDFLFENQAQLNPDNIRDKITQFVAANVTIDQGEYRSCVDNDLAMGPVKKEIDLGQKLGVRGTPTIFINGALYSGFKDAPQLHELIEAAQRGDFHAATLSPNSAAGGNSVRSAACPPKAQSASNR